MENKLFLVCPFSNLEEPIRRKYGSSILFMTSIAGVFQSDEKEYLHSVARILEKNQINSIHVVNDVDCPFINNVVCRDPLFGTKSEIILENIYIDHLETLGRLNSLRLKKMELAKINLEIQSKELKNSEILAPLIERNKIKIVRVLTEKSRSKFWELGI